MPLHAWQPQHGIVFALALFAVRFSFLAWKEGMTRKRRGNHLGGIAGIVLRVRHPFLSQ